MFRNFVKMQKMSYDPLLIDIFGDLANSNFPSYKGLEYDKINFRNDKMRILGDIKVAMREAKAGVMQ